MKKSTNNSQTNHKKEKLKKDKSAPMEMSTKKAGGSHSLLINPAIPKAFDPRFREECGEIDKIGLIKNYAFLQKNREAEIRALTNAIQNPKDPSDVAYLKKRKQSLMDQYKTNDAKIKDVEERIKWHQEERKRILEGKKPFWLDKKAMREREQQKKFNELKESGKLQKYLAKKRKKQFAKDKKYGLGAGGIF